MATVAVLVVGLLVAAMAVFGFGFFERSTANFRGQTNVINQTKGNGTYRIAAYNQFYDQCAAVQTDERRIANTKQELSTTTDAGRKLQLEANLDAQQNQRADDINQYNANARKSATVGQFRASNLPYQLDPTQEVTSCIA